MKFVNNSNKQNIKNKIKIIDSISTIVSMIMITGIIYILYLDDFQFFFNIRLIVFTIIFSIIGFYLGRKRLDLFAETL